jgi:hypothetical protein
MNRRSQAIGFILLIAVVVFVALYFVRRIAVNQLQGELRKSAEVAAEQLKDRVETFISERIIALQGVGTFFENSTEVTEGEFSAFARSTIEDVPGFQAIEYVTPDAIVAMAVRLLDLPEWAEVVAGLAVLTGRWVSELLATAQFEPKSLWSVIFRGALKRGNEQGLQFEIPTLTTAQRVCRALDMIRRELPQAKVMSVDKINQSYELAVVRPVKSILRAWCPPGTARIISILICFAPSMPRSRPSGIARPL